MSLTTYEIILTTLSIFSLITIIFLFLRVERIKKTYKLLTKDVKSGNIEDILKQNLHKIGETNERIKIIEKRIDEVIQNTQKHFQKIALKRFNPFQLTGGDHSFVIVLLDDNNNGVILSSLHQRDMTRIYAKEVKEGKCEHKLLKEEEETLNNILNNVSK